MPTLVLDEKVSLRDILAAYPQTRPVLAKYGMLECGGAAGPDEPLGWFARVHQVEPATLMYELQQAITGAHTVESSGTPQSTAGEAAPDADHLYRRFLVTAVIFTLTGGVLWGAINLSLIGYHHAFVAWLTAGNQAHAHVQIFGWVALFIMGVAYHVLPRLKVGQLQHVGLGFASYWLMTGGVVLHAFYRPFMTNPALAPIPVIAALMELAAILFFAVVIVETMRKGAAEPHLSDKYLVVGVVSMLAMGVANVVMLSLMAAHNTAILPEAWNWAYRHVQLVGFAGMFIFGVSLRTLPVFLGKPQPSVTLDRIVFPLLVAGILLRATFDVLVNLGIVSPAALALPAALEITGALGMIWNLGFLKRPAYSMDGMSLSRSYEKYLYAGYTWLLVSVVFIAALTLYHAVTGHTGPHALMGSYRHALTVGFITILIMGYSMRIIPVFLGRPIYSDRLLNGAFAFIMTGCTLRVVFQALTVPFGSWPFAVAGMSGWFEAVGLGLFGYNLLRTLYAAEPAVQAQPAVMPEANDVKPEITSDLTIARLVDAYPQSVDALLEMGFDPIVNPMLRQTLGKKITLEAASRIKQIPLEQMLERLKKAV